MSEELPLFGVLEFGELFGLPHYLVLALLDSGQLPLIIGDDGRPLVQISREIAERLSLETDCPRDHLFEDEAFRAELLTLVQQEFDRILKESVRSLREES